MLDRSEPDPFLDSFTGLVAARALTTAVVLGVFDALHEQPASAPELAERLGLDPLGAETLITALTTLGYVEDGGDGRVRNAPVTERLLVRSSPESIATFVGDQADLHWQVLELLPDAVRGGRPYAMHEERRGDDGALGGVYPRAVRDLASRARRERGARAGGERRVGWWTWRAATGRSRWRCAAAIRGSRPP